MTKTPEYNWLQKAVLAAEAGFNKIQALLKGTQETYSDRIHSTTQNLDQINTGAGVDMQQKFEDNKINRSGTPSAHSNLALPHENIEQQEPPIHPSERAKLKDFAFALGKPVHKETIPNPKNPQKSKISA